MSVNIISSGEEVRDSAIVVPRSMIIAQIINFALTMAFSVVILFGTGDIKQTLTGPTKYPIIQMFLNATGSKKATTAMAFVLIFGFLFSTLGLLACASRLVWAFARDKGLPFSGQLSHVSNYESDCR